MEIKKKHHPNLHRLDCLQFMFLQRESLFLSPCKASERPEATAVSVHVSHDLSTELQCLMSLCRCFTFGIGQNACRRLVQGLATVSKGTAEFLADGERLQPKVLISRFVYRQQAILRATREPLCGGV